MLAGLGFNAAKALRAFLTRSLVIECDRVPFRFERVPPRKILNWILVEASLYARRRNPWGWPTHVQIEPTNRCNLRCALCPITDGMDRPSGDMSWDVFTKLVDEAGKYIFIMMLWDWGEPFLNPRLCDMILYARQRGIKTLVSTNGHFIRSRERAEQLVRSGLDALIIAVDGIRQETYEKYRGEGNLGFVFDGIRRIVEAKKTLKSVNPLVNLRFVVMKHNELEIPELPDLARSLGADMLTLRTLHSHGAKGLLKCPPQTDQYYPENPQHQRYRIAPNGTAALHKRSNNPCRKLWNSTTVHWNGKVSPCCFDPHDRYVLGDLSRTDFREIWTGLRYRQMRHSFRKNYLEIPVCSDCSYAFEGGTLGTEDILAVHHFETA